jgi:ornithine cyclodeaminase
LVLVLRRHDIGRAVSPVPVMDMLHGYYRSEHPDVTAVRCRADLPARGTAMVLLPGLLPGIAAYTVKVNAKFPGASPAIRGVVCLHSLDDGALLALADSASITTSRTGLAAALATDLLARPGADSVAIIGAGAQARSTLAGLTARRPIRRLVVVDVDRAAAEVFAEEHSAGIGDVDVVDNAGSAAAAAEILITATWSREPVLRRSDLREGQHVTSLGADEAGKRELGDDVLADCVLVVDDRALASGHGALSAARAGEDIAAVTLGEVLRGERPGRRAHSDLTVFSPVGLPWLDLALTWHVYQVALERGLGQSLADLHD